MLIVNDGREIMFGVGESLYGYFDFYIFIDGSIEIVYVLSRFFDGGIVRDIVMGRFSFIR